MATPSFTVKYRELSENFAHHIAMADRGRAFEVKEGSKVVAIVARNSQNITSEHVFTEAQAGLKLRALFDLVRDGKDVVITRLGDKASLIITNPNKQDGPK